MEREPRFECAQGVSREIIPACGPNSLKKVGLLPCRTMMLHLGICHGVDIICGTSIMLTYCSSRKMLQRSLFYLDKLHSRVILAYHAGLFSRGWEVMGGENMPIPDAWRSTSRVEYRGWKMGKYTRSSALPTADFHLALQDVYENTRVSRLSLNPCGCLCD